MAANLLLYFTATGHTLYRAGRHGLQREAQFSPDEAGVARFRDCLSRHAGALVQLVADLAGEDFHEDQIPYLRGGERQIVIERRLAQRYRDTRLATALSLGFAADERRNERLLLASFNNTQQFAPWLDVLEEAGARLAGVYSTGLLAPSLAARLGVRSGSCFVVSVNRAGLRQCFVENGRLRFSRLGRANDAAGGLSPEFIRTETERLLQYLGTLRALARDGPAMRVLLIVPEDERALFEQALVRDARLAFTTIGSAEAARRIGLRNAPEGGLAELLYLRLTSTQPPKEQFVRGEDRRGFLIWRLRRSIVAAGALAFSVCAAYAATLWLENLTVREHIAGLRAEADEARGQFQRIAARFPATPTTIENLKSAALEFRAIAARSASPEDALAYVSRALGQAPQIEVDEIAWSARPATDPGDAKPAPGATRPDPATTDAPQTLEIAGRVDATQRSDYRAIAEHVERFAALLAADPAWRVVATRLPFDITPQGTLSGGIGSAADSRDAPRFTIWVARRQE